MKRFMAERGIRSRDLLTIENHEEMDELVRLATIEEKKRLEIRLEKLEEMQASLPAKIAKLQRKIADLGE